MFSITCYRFRSSHNKNVSLDLDWILPRQLLVWKIDLELGPGQQNWPSFWPSIFNVVQCIPIYIKRFLFIINLHYITRENIVPFSLENYKIFLNTYSRIGRHWYSRDENFPCSQYSYNIILWYMHHIPCITASIWWRSGVKHSPLTRKVRCSNPNRDIPKSLIQVVTTPLSNAR